MSEESNGDELHRRLGGLEKWNPKRPDTVEEYLETEEEEDMGQYDSFVYGMNPPIEDRLETYLMERKLI